MPSRVPLVAGVVFLVTATTATAQTVGYTASVFAARGTYGGDAATSVYLFNTVDVTGGPVRVSASVPFVRQRVTFPADPVTGVTGAAETYTGLGDPLIRADVRLLDDRTRGIHVALAGSVKPSMVDAATGRGTGAADYGAGATLFALAGRTSLFADAMFWKYGDPEGVEYPDAVSYGIGAGRLLGNGRWSALVSLAGFSRGIDGGQRPMQLNVTLLTLAARRQSVAITAGAGLNDDSGDFTLGMSWRIAR